MPNKLTRREFFKRTALGVGLLGLIKGSSQAYDPYEVHINAIYNIGF